jgi:hypothetical protein
MEEILIRLSGLSGVTGSFFVGDDNSFIAQTLSKGFNQENAQRSVMVLSQTLEALAQVAQFNVAKLLVNTGGSRLFIRRTDKGYLNVLADLTVDPSVIDAALNGAMQEIKLLATLAPAPTPRPGSGQAPSAPTAAPPAATPQTRPVPQAPAPAPRPGTAQAPAPAPAAAPTPRPGSVQTAPPAPPAMVDGSILEKVLALAEEALGELGSTIYENQYADHKINPAKLSRDAAMKFCYALQKDASMIIGPSAAKQMADKMMLLLK